MTDASRTPIGFKIRELRKGLGLTQAQMAKSLEISAPYLNLMESNKRPVSDALLPNMAQLLKVDLEQLTGTTERRQMDDLAELSSDVLLDGLELEKEFAAEVVGRYPNWTRAILRLGQQYREQAQALSTLSDRFNRDPALGATMHRILNHTTAIRSSSEILGDTVAMDPEQRQRFGQIVLEESQRLSAATESLINVMGRDADTTSLHSAPQQVDDFIVHNQSFFPALEDAADDLRSRIDALGSTTESALVEFLEAAHGISVVGVKADSVDRSGFRNGSRYDEDTRTMALLEYAPGTTRRFQLARLVCSLSCPDVLEASTITPELTTDPARNQANAYLASYMASAMLFPYSEFFQDAETHRYDLQLLRQRYSASFEQVAHRLVTLRRPGEEGVPFAFLRSDPAGFVTKRYPLPGFPLPRYGNACPLWAIYPAFQTPDRIVRQVVEFASGDRYLFIARTVTKQRANFMEPRFVHSVMLMTSVLDADRTVYADGLDLDTGEFDVPVGPGCRLCSRDDCSYREEPAAVNLINVTRDT